MSASSSFLNGVCRHERTPYLCDDALNFLNGVCRHEPKSTA
ncbi:hypothetical protein URS_2228 [Acinetobacter ursingii]|nr:hypothetical protein URS_2228 [Acinetobacter ursingii]